jgi:methylase of polypeptide subunit release factors
LGLTYEKYLASVLQSAPPAPQIELFREAERDVDRLSVRKWTGAYYTPIFITRYLAERCVSAFFEDHEETTVPNTIDFACGSGSFLVAVVDQILRRLKTRDPDRHWARELIEGEFIAGIDVDSKAVTAARLNLWQRLLEEPGALPLPSLTRVVIQADGLRRDTWRHLDRSYDIVMGNPPFNAWRRVLDRTYLEANFASARGRYDFSYLFVEQAVHILAPKGCLGMVVPSRLFRNDNGRALRDLLAKETDLVTLVDFGSNEPFAGAKAHVALVVARRRRPDDPKPDRIRVLEVRKLVPQFMAAVLLDAERADADSREAIVRSYTAKHPQDGSPWILLSEAEQRTRIVMEEESDELGTVSGIFQGIRTGANDLFIFDVEESDETSFSRVINGVGDVVIIENDLLKPVVYGSELQRYQVIRSRKVLLYPYQNRTVLTEAELEANYPHVWSYLQRNRNYLLARVSLSETGRRWYELVRPRDPAWLAQPKLLIRDLAPRTSFAVDQGGGLFLVGGTAVVPQQAEMLMPLLAYLNSSVIDGFLRRQTPQFRTGFHKFEPRHLQRIPVLRHLIDDVNLSDQLASLATEVIAYRALAKEDRAEQVESQINALIRCVIEEGGAGWAV